MVRGEGPYAIGVREPVHRLFREAGRHGGIVEHQPGQAVGQGVGMLRRRHTEHGPRVRNHVRHPITRVVRVDGHERGTGLRDRPHGGHRFDRPRQCHRDDVLGPGAAGHQQPRQSSGPLVELAVGELLDTGDQRECLGIAVRRRGQQIGQRRRRGRIEPGRAGQLGDLLGAEQVDVPDDGVRVGDHGSENAQEPVCERLHGRRVEQVCGVGELARHPVREATLADRFPEGELQIELRDLRVEFDLVDREVGQLEMGRAQVLERQHHLDQRVAGGRPRGVEDLDEPLERDVGVRERPERHVPRVREQIGEPRTGFDVGAQHERVDEHADQVVERLLAASGHRGADRDVVGRGGTGQQHRQRRVHHHEQRRVAFVRDRDQCAVHVRRHREVDLRAAIGLPRRARTVRRQVELVG
ncbi:hypothetical protein RE9431_36590 [Prescottella equi]|nr:hypothetical protein RE9431_36590 [Prescottella equi]